MITSDSVAAAHLVRVVKEKLEQALLPYVGQHNTMATRMAIVKVLSRDLSIPVSPNDINKWMSFKERGDKLDVILNHTLMMENPDAVPDWVWAVFWSFNPNFAPHFKV
jgi:hypothetical protein